jgi:hypothetical protein
MHETFRDGPISRRNERSINWCKHDPRVLCGWPVYDAQSSLIGKY